MKAGLGSCADDDQLDAYVLGTLPRSRIAAFEEHLFLCASCQDRLALTEQFVHSMRRVAPRLRQELTEKKEPPFQVTPWIDRLVATLAGTLAYRPTAVAVVAVAVLMMAGPWLRQRMASSGGGEPVLVELESFRGTAGTGRAPASHPLLFSIRAADVPASPGYQLEMVDSRGVRRSKTSLTRDNGRLQVLLGGQTEPGHYFLRLLSADGSLLREYSLEVTPDSRR